MQSIYESKFLLEVIIDNKRSLFNDIDIRYLGKYSKDLFYNNKPFEIHSFEVKCCFKSQVDRWLDRYLCYCKHSISTGPYQNDQFYYITEEQLALMILESC